MGHFFTRIFVNAFALAIIASVFPWGIHIQAETQRDQLITLVGVALIFGLVNAFVKPILKLLACSLIFFTLGLFLLVINGALFMLTAELSARLPFLPGRLVVDNFGWAILGAVLMSIIGVITERALGLAKHERTEVRTEVRYVQPPPPRPIYPPQPPTNPNDVYYPPQDPYGRPQGPQDPYGRPPGTPGEKPKRQ